MSKRYLYKPSRKVLFEDMGNHRWKYVEAPPSLAQNMVGLPISKNEFGVIATDRMILQSHCEKAGLVPIRRGTI